VSHPLPSFSLSDLKVDSITGCGPCKAIAPTFESLARSNSNVVFVKVDVDQNQPVAQRYGVSAMPTFLFLRKGAILDTLRGANAGKLTSLTTQYSKTGVGFQGAGQTIGGGRSLGSGQGHNAAAQGGGFLGLINSVPRENLLPFIVVVGYLAYVILGKS
jgi:thioredoxin 1